MSDVMLEIEKRLTLNWLIQGAAQHAAMTFHHLVRDELNALEPKLVRLYDQFALVGLLQYWQFDAAIILGRPRRFWRQAESKSTHPFFGHPLLPKFGGMLAEAARKQAVKRCKEKGVSRLPIAFSIQIMSLLRCLRKLEVPYRSRLVRLAQEATSSVWGIPSERLEGELTDRIMLGGMLPPRTTRGAMLRACIKGYVVIEPRDDTLMIVGKATNWQLLAHEFVKGTAELICLHGLNHLSEDVYRHVMEATDRLEFEPWMLQSGGELWRRLVESTPDGRQLAQILMRLALLPAKDLHSLVAAVIERPELARERLVELADEGRR